MYILRGGKWNIGLENKITPLAWFLLYTWHLLRKSMRLAEGKKLSSKHFFAQSLPFEEVAERSVLYVYTLRFRLAVAV